MDVHDIVQARLDQNRAFRQSHDIGSGGGTAERERERARRHGRLKANIRREGSLRGWYGYTFEAVATTTGRLHLMYPPDERAYTGASGLLCGHALTYDPTPVGARRWYLADDALKCEHCRSMVGQRATVRL